jgi:hypothetical protein
MRPQWYNYSQHREGVKNLLSPEESNKSLGLTINSWRIRGKLADKIGKGKYTLTEYEKIKRITMPLGDKYLLYVTTEVEADHSKRGFPRDLFRGGIANPN